MGGGHLYLKLNINLVHRLGVQKTCKIGGENLKSVFLFGHVDKVWKGKRHANPALGLVTFVQNPVKGHLCKLRTFKKIFYCSLT